MVQHRSFRENKTYWIFIERAVDKAFLKPMFLTLAASFACFIIGLAVRLQQAGNNQTQITYAVAIAAGFAILSWRLWETADSWLPKVRSMCEEHSRAIDNLNLSDARLALWIALIAAVGLYAELSIIRIHAAYFQLFAHFKNVSLLSCFLGLGIGYAQKHDRPLTTPLVIPLFACQVILFTLLLHCFELNFMILNPTSEQATMGLYNATDIADKAMSYGLLLFVFIFNALAFVPLGQLASRLMAKKSKLDSYGLNLMGSLAGIVLIVVLSYLWTPPAVWFFFIFLGLLPFLRKKGGLFISTVCATVALCVLSVPLKIFRLDIHSPYQIISVILEPENPRLYSNNTWFQTMLDLRDFKLGNRPDLKPLADYYALAYQFKPAPENVLIVGSGSGNDVASALRHGAKHVDAVEIDPAIIKVGKTLHPEQPYSDPRVTVHADDARSFIRRTKNKYDLIVYGLLDSATSMSGNSAGMRMDSYVWTVEAFKEARARLNDGGVISMAACIYDAMGPKLYKMLTQTFDGQLSPYVYKTNWDAGFTFIIGEGISRPSSPPPFEELTDIYRYTSVNEVISTDDWPFLFMFKKTYPWSYMAVILSLFLISALMVRKLLPAGKKGEFSAPAFFLGAGFMLVETKGITQLALVYGSTWLVTSAVIASILVLAFFANWLVASKKQPPLVVTYILIGASLALGYYMCGVDLSTMSVNSERLVMTVAMTLPLFFSGMAFSQEVERLPSVSVALSSNLLGAMLGGFLEYNALYFGYKSLFWFAFVLYFMAFVFALRKHSSPAQVEEPALVPGSETPAE